MGRCNVPFALFDVVLVPFPYVDRLAEKRRPAVVISAPELEARYGLIWLAMVTSASNPRWDCDVDIVRIKPTGLPAPSRIRPAKIATADPKRVVRRIGQLASPDANAVRESLQKLAAFA
jgi:mRNA interferase MazF